MIEPGAITELVTSSPLVVVMLAIMVGMCWRVVIRTMFGLVVVLILIGVITVVGR